MSSRPHWNRQGTSKVIRLRSGLAALAVLAFAHAAQAQDSRDTPPTTGALPGDRPVEEARDRDRGEVLRIGPLVGVGFPRPLQIEGMVKIAKVVGLGVEYGFLPKISVAGVEASFKGVAGDLRIFPFKNAFFIGARGGRQWLDGSGTLTVGGIAYTEAMAAATWFINPRIGFLHTFESGLTIGIDAGVQLPVGPTYERTGPATSLGLAENTDIDRSLRTAANTLGNGVTPTVDLLKVGFLF